MESQIRQLTCRTNKVSAQLLPRFGGKSIRIVKRAKSSRLLPSGALVHFRLSANESSLSAPLSVGNFPFGREKRRWQATEVSPRYYCFAPNTAKIFLGTVSIRKKSIPRQTREITVESFPFLRSGIICFSRKRSVQCQTIK